MRRPAIHESDTARNFSGVYCPSSFALSAPWA
jgi:hypothetical protein